MKLILALSMVGCLILLAVAGWLLNRTLLRRNNRLGKHRVAAALRKFSRIRFFKTRNDVALSFNGETHRADHVVIGFFGVLLVHTVEEDGDYFGDAKDKNWVRTTEDYRRTQIPNPLLELEETAVFLRTLFSKNNIYRIPIETLVVFAGRPKKTTINISNRTEHLLPIAQLSGYLGKTKFEKDAGVDVDALARVFDTYRG